MPQKFAINNDLSIEYHVLNDTKEGIPLVIVPGAVVGAAEVVESIRSNCNIKTIVISLRGRGESSKPIEGYSLEEQVSDIESVVKNEKLDAMYILGHSNGAGIAAKFALMNKNIIKGLILADFPPGYPPFPAEWAEHVKSNRPDVSENLINGLARDSVKQFFLDELAASRLKVSLLKSGGEDSLLQAGLAEKIQATIPGCEYKIIENSGHEMFNENPKEVFAVVKKFMEAK